MLDDGAAVGAGGGALPRPVGRSVRWRRGGRGGGAQSARARHRHGTAETVRGDGPDPTGHSGRRHVVLYRSAGSAAGRLRR